MSSITYSERIKIETFFRTRAVQYPNGRSAEPITVNNFL
ncbi:hypothetical protein N624_0414 [Levilactobacillus brevis]|nr:hypothetical protein N624_0414 [Levilactobacillus brevis]